MDVMDKELIDEKLKLIYLTIEKNHLESALKQDRILEQVLKTNGRVTCLERETAFITFLTKNPKMIILSVLGLVFITNLNELGPVIKGLIQLFS